METDFHQIPLVCYATAAAAATDNRNVETTTEWWKPGINSSSQCPQHERRSNSLSFGHIVDCVNR